MIGHQYIRRHQLIVEHDILAWLDTIPLSQPAHHLESNFADGILIAEIIDYFFPEYVNLEIFRVARSMSQRIRNWRLLNSDILPKINLHAPGTVVHGIVNGDRRAVELFLLHLREKLEEHLIHTGRTSRLQWETRRSFNKERQHLPLVLTARTPRRPPPPLLSHYRSDTQSGRVMNTNVIPSDDVVRIKDEEIEVLHGKLEDYEKLLRRKDKQIEDLEAKLRKIKSK